MGRATAPRRPPALRAQLFRVLAVACALPLLLLALLEVTIFGRFEREAALVRTGAVAERIARETEAYVEEHLRAVESLAQTLERHPDSGDAEEDLERFRRRYPGFLTMLLASPEGEVTAASPALDAAGVRHADRRRSVADRPYFRSPLATGRPFVSAAFQGRGFGNDPIVAVSAPVRAPGRGAVTGVVEGSLDLGRLRDVILPVGGLPGTEVAVADADGVVVFSTIAGVEPLGRQPPDTPDRLTAHAPVGDLGWRTTARVARNAVDVGRNPFLIASALATLLALAVGFFLVRRNAVVITGPLRSLVDSLHSYEAGRGFRSRGPDGAPAEVLELFGGFSALADRLTAAHVELQEVLVGLERQVLERTETLRESEERFRQLAENVDAVFWVRAVAPPRMLYISPAYETLWERPRVELEGDAMAFTQSIHPDDRDRALAAIARQPEGPYEQEYRIVCPRGEVKWVRSIGFPVRGPDGAVIRIAGLSEDITAARRLEQMRQDLTHMMVHDLRSPLTAVMAGIDAVRNGQFDASANRRFLDTALASTQKMKFLIDAILDVSRLEAGSFPLEIANADLGALVAEVCRSYEALASARQVSLALPATPDPIEAAIDSDLVRRVIENLLGNAIKFTPARGRVEIAVEREEAAVRVGITDDGPGIDPELAGRLFEKFVTGRRAGGGSGLGLAFCRLAIEALGGTIGLRSEPGGGTTFHFTVPLAGAPRSSGPRAQPSGPVV